ncbi:MAG: ChaN family lipoprotein [bacterium]
MRRRFADILILAAMLVASSSLAQEVLPLPELDEALRLEMTNYLEDQRLSPEDYVLSRFAEHDIVILGEQHRAKQDPLLVQRLIPRLPEIGVYTLCTEFARRVDQPLIDSLLAGAEYDQKLAESIDLRQFVHWGYAEYVDIFKAAWQYNHDRVEGTRPFRILALGNSPEWWYVTSQEDRDNPEVQRKVWHGETEEDWARVVLDEVIGKGDKALCYCGIHHAFTEYRQPVVNNGEFVRFIEDRFGNFVYKAIGKRAITIYLHNIWINAEGYDAPYVYPADGYIDALMEFLGPDGWNVGFNTKDTPFGKLPGKSSIYSFGYENFTLEQFCDGYIFQVPFRLFEPVTCIDSFYTEDNIDYARRNAVNPWYRDKSIEVFEESCEESRQENIARWSRLQ